MASSPIAAVSWDVDGTLYDVRRMRRAMLVAAVGRAARGRPLRVYRELSLLARLKSELDRVRAAGGDLARARWPAPRAELDALARDWYGPAIARAGARPGVRALIDALGERGVRQVVVSDHEPGYKLAALGLGGAFEAVFCGETVGRIKPSPAALGAAMAALGVEKDRLLHIGDRADTDGVAAAAIGCRTAILGREFASFFELRDRLCAELARP